MKKKYRGKKSNPIKQKNFQDRNISSLENLRRDGKTVKSPFSALPGNIQTRSWYNECIPNILWACILASSLERDDYLALFRTVASNVREKVPAYENTFVTHNFLSVLGEAEFDAMFADVFAHPTACQHLKALRLVDSLPDRAHWDRHLPPPSPKEDWQIIAHAVFETFDHQSEKSTDIRWLKVMHLIVCGRIHFPQKMAERVEEYRLYPNKGDMRSVRPSIRALEIGFRDLEEGKGLPKGVVVPPNPQESFWSETRLKTECILSAKFEPPSQVTKDFAIGVARIFEATNLFPRGTLTLHSYLPPVMRRDCRGRPI